MTLFESIADRRIGEARRAGLFDDLPGKGRPIADLDRERPAGWWAARVVRTERDMMRFEELTAEVKRAMPALWRQESEAGVIAAVTALNAKISAHNASTGFEPVTPVPAEATVRRWRALRASGTSSYRVGSSNR